MVDQCQLALFCTNVVLVELVDLKECLVSAAALYLNHTIYLHLQHW